MEGTERRGGDEQCCMSRVVVFSATGVSRSRVVVFLVSGERGYVRTRYNFVGSAEEVLEGTDGS